MTRRSSKVRTWRAASGAWLGIGTAPGALVLGAQVGGRHDGALPLIVLVVGGAVMAALLAAQGRLGLRAPAGEDAGMTDLAPRYLPPMAERAFTALLAAAMVGWFGFNVGLGGAAAAALVGVPDAARRGGADRPDGRDPDRRRRPVERGRGRHHPHRDRADRHRRGAARSAGRRR
ncbi:hypothetical protein [Actinomadura madurae]|uniref:hypothetical protein n=1 Tax=Actinomadura madurae TaxID=1993 RepID=UPI0020D1F5C6|nr:hypothetical protein [Actinomadura madurae]MCP9953799.1 hypothetical protein [Actinomadura madurae]MCQ0019265.1 hypothetical protein [Actinomadura madurae]